MSEPQPYRLIIKTFLKSNAKLLKFIPLKSIIAGEIFEITFQFQNISDETFPGGRFRYMIEWPSGQSVKGDFEIPSLKMNEVHKTPPEKTEALCEGFGLIFVNDKIPWFVKDKQNRSRPVHVYRGKREIDLMTPEASIAPIKAKRSEEIYEFWAMIISAIGLLIVALEKIFAFLSWLFRSQHLTGRLV